VAFVVPVPFPARVTANTNGSGFDTILYARSACLPRTFCPAPPPVPDAGLPALDATLDPADAVSADGSVDAAAPAVDSSPLPADAAPEPGDAAVADAAAPGCVEGSTEVACDDDGGDGVQSLLDFVWGGGDLYLFVDGFGAGGGDYALTVSVTFPAGGLCDPGAPEYMRCEEGTACVRQADATARCVP
jgi:hypothetical protein